jgi:hypothetical protein
MGATINAVLGLRVRRLVALQLSLSTLGTRALNA